MSLLDTLLIIEHPHESVECTSADPLTILPLSILRLMPSPFRMHTFITAKIELQTIDTRT